MGCPLRMSRVDLQLITDNDMYNCVENSIRGRISMVSTRHAQANNPSFPYTFDASLPRQDLIYLYGWAMSQFLPTHGFRFLQQEEISTLRLQDLSDDDEDGYILEVDIHYPTSLHNHHDDYPLAPESLVIDCSMYSPTQQPVFPDSAPQKKFTPNFQEKVKYAVHYCNLKLYLQLGLVVTKVHRVLAFKQSPLGIAELVNDAGLSRKRVAKPTFCRGKPITDCLTIIQSKVATLTLNHPIYVGFTVLELSKLHMYDFQYNHMKVKYAHAHQLRLFFTDTDSLAYAVQTDDIYKVMATDVADRYDFSEYPLYLTEKHFDSSKTS